MSWFLHSVFSASCAALAGAIGGIVFVFLKRWVLAHFVAKRATLVALLMIVLLVAEIQMLWTAPGPAAPLLVHALPAGDPSVRARALAEGISEVMNSLALDIPAVLLGGIGWLVSRGRLTPAR